MRAREPRDRESMIVDIVRQKAEHLRREKGAGADKPCVRCLHYEPGNWSWLLPFTARCAHPVFTDYRVNRVSGALVARSQTTPADARQPGSLCGPDAFLFEEKSRWRRFKKWIGRRFGKASVGQEQPRVAR